MTSAKYPWLKWQPKKFRASLKVRRCSLAARGLWIDMLGLMHEAEPYGHLVDGKGRALSADDLALLIATPAKDVKRALAELETHEVFSRTPEGTIYSRRMLKDAEKAEKDRANGRGGGNPQITGGGKDKPEVNAKDKDEVNGGVNPPDNPDVNQPVKPGVKAKKKRGIEEEKGTLSGAFAGAREADRGTLRDAVAFWNETARASGFPLAERLPPNRKAALVARLAGLADPTDPTGLAGWRTAVRRAGASSYLRGRKADGKASDFRPGIDFLLKDDTFTRLVEGNYDDRTDDGSDGPGADNGFAELGAAARASGLRLPN